MRHKGVIYMNEKACRTFAKHGDLIGRISLIATTARNHSKIRELLETRK